MPWEWGWMKGGEKMFETYVPPGKDGGHPRGRVATKKVGEQEKQGTLRGYRMQEKAHERMSADA